MAGKARVVDARDRAVFREQLRQAAEGDPAGPIGVWIWPQGPFTPQSWQAVQYAGTDTAGSYLQALRQFSAALAR